MYIDYENLFSNAQAITADAVSTNVIDLGATWNHGVTPLVVAFALPAAFNTLTSLNINVQVATDAAFTSPLTIMTRNLLLAELTLGAQFSVPVPMESVKRFIRVQYDVVGTNPTLGQIDAWLTTPDMVSRGLAVA